MKRLNGWQRLGVVLSAVWFIFAFVGMQVWNASAQHKTANNIYQLCTMVADQNQQNHVQAQKFAAQHVQDLQRALGRAEAQRDASAITTLNAEVKRARQMQQALAKGYSRSTADDECRQELARNGSAPLSKFWWADLLGALIPLALVWLLAWAGVRVYRWIRVGFAENDA